MLCSLRPAEQLPVSGPSVLPRGSFHKTSVSEAAQLFVICDLKETPVRVSSFGLELNLH